MYSIYIIVSYTYLVCYDYVPVMPTHAVSIATPSQPYYAHPVPTQSAGPTMPTQSPLSTIQSTIYAPT